MNDIGVPSNSNMRIRISRLPATFLLICNLFLFGDISTAQAFTIIFRDSASVASAAISLADVADCDGDSELSRALCAQIIAPSPDAGKKIRLNSDEIRRKLNTELPATEDVSWKGAAEISVERKAEIVTASEIQEVIASYLKEQSRQWPQATITFTPKEPPLPFAVPIGDLQWEVTPSNPGIIGSTRFSLIGRIDKEIVKNFSVKGTLEIMAPVAVATTNLRNGDILEPSHFQMEPRDLSQLRAPCLQADQAVGKVLLRGIKAGNIIELASLESPPVVKKGTLVKIIARRNGLELTATGVAKTDGKEGEIIKIINASSAKEIFCRVLSQGLVEVQI